MKEVLWRPFDLSGKSLSFEKQSSTTVRLSRADFCGEWVTDIAVLNARSLDLGGIICGLYVSVTNQMPVIKYYRFHYKRSSLLKIEIKLITKTRYKLYQKLNCKTAKYCQCLKLKWRCIILIRLKRFCYLFWPLCLQQLVLRLKFGLTFVCKIFKIFASILIRRSWCSANF